MTMNAIGVDRASAMPLYHQIYLELRDDILAGRRGFGSILPTEIELSGVFGVSRITPRRALDELAAQQLVERRRRTGTRVIFKAQLALLEGDVDQAVDSLIAFGRNTKVEVREISREAASDEVADALKVVRGDPVVRAVRIRFLHGAALGEVVSYVPASLGKLITRANLTKRPMLEVLMSAGFRIGDARQSITATLANAALAGTLGIKHRAPILCVRRIVSDPSGSPLLATTAQYCGDRYVVNLGFHGAAQATGE